MKKFSLLLLRFTATVLSLALLGVGARVHLGDPPDHSVLRLSWSHVGEQITRKLTQDELDALPIHMRPPDGIAESTPVPYRLIVTINGNSRIDEIVQPGGVKGDRPMYVLKSLELKPGRYEVDILFHPAEDFPDAKVYRMNRQVELDLGQIRLIDLDSGRGELILK
jgi:hypothetical protein